MNKSTLLIVLTSLGLFLSTNLVAAKVYFKNNYLRDVNVSGGPKGTFKINTLKNGDELLLGDSVEDAINKSWILSNTWGFSQYWLPKILANLRSKETQKDEMQEDFIITVSWSDSGTDWNLSVGSRKAKSE